MFFFVAQVKKVQFDERVFRWVEFHQLVESWLISSVNAFNDLFVGNFVTLDPKRGNDDELFHTF